MKQLLLVILLLPACAHARTVDSSRNSIGVYNESNVISGSRYFPAVSTVGIMYKRIKKEDVIYSFTAGYCKSVSNEPVGGKMISGSTDIMRSVKKDINIAVAGVGIERQRHFYRKVYFLAGLDWKLGYGSGTTRNVTTYETWVPGTSPSMPYGEVHTTESSSPGPGISMFLLYGAPYIGAKLEFKRFALGMIVMNYVKSEFVQSGSRNNLTFDFNTSNFSTRLFVTHKF